MSGIIGTISVIVLFILCIVSYRKIKEQHEELLRVYKELDDSEQLIKRMKLEENYNELEIKSKMLPILEKIQRNYRISKMDKIKLLDYFSHLIYTLRHYEILDIMYTMNTSKTFTFKEATNNIIGFINHKHDKPIQEVVESIYFLITK